MKNGDQVILVVKESGKDSRLAVKEILLDDSGILAVTNPRTSPGWPMKLRLRPERIEESPTLLGHQNLYFYQDDVVRP